MQRRLGALAVLILVLPFLIASPAIAKGPPVVVIIPEGFPVTDINPCTGQEHEIGGPLTLRIHEFEHNGRYHANIQFRYDTVTSDGFTGTTIGPDVDNALDGQGRFTSIANATLKSDSGQIMKARFHFQFFYDDGEITKALVEDWTTWCVGKPN
ncbi:MAG TPA: hypothetical protein VLY63_32975 [Anaerolineae bacterium]|nr:hypothetical protein [Anaerolineae bacterium]